MAKILVVEDEKDNRDLVRMTLEMLGHDITEAVTAEEGLRKLGASRPDVILMDLSLPGGYDGLEATRRIRADPSCDDLPILALTAHTMAGDRERALAAGCDAHIAKPLLDLRAFAEIVGRFAAEGRAAAD